MNGKDNKSGSIKQSENFVCVDKKIALINVRITKINTALIESVKCFDEYIKQMNLGIGNLGEHTEQWIDDLESKVNEAINILHKKIIAENQELSSRIENLELSFKTENQELRLRIENQELRSRTENQELRSRIETLEHLLKKS
jgi:hypothetical protein